MIERVLGEYEVSTVIHLAAQTIVGIANRNPVSTFDSNIRGTWTVLEACRRSPLVTGVVVASSDKAYGDSDELPYSEDHPLLAEHPYDVSKACADIITRSYAVTYGLPAAIARCGNFYGGGDLNWNRIVPGTIRSLLKGEDPVIRSDGTLLRDYLYVEDGVSAYLQLAEAVTADPQLKGEAFNFSVGQPISVLELVDSIAAAVGVDCEPVIQGNSHAEIVDQYLSSERAHEVLGWRSGFSLAKGLELTISWYKRFFEEQTR
jgi:CDP-glucose 4,6-dehydratase